MKLSTSREEYLKVIYILKNNKGTVRSIDIAQHMGISKPSVCIAVKQLEEQGYIKKDPAGLIELTDSGKPSWCLRCTAFLSRYSWMPVYPMNRRILTPGGWSMPSVRRVLKP